MAEMTANHSERVKTLQIELTTTKDQEQSLREKSRSAERERKELRQEVAILKAENKTMATKHSLFYESSGIDPEDLECALELIERFKASELGSTRKWAENEDDGVTLKAKVDELQIQNGELVLECNRTQNLLESQIDLNKKLERDLHRASTKMAVTMDHEDTFALHEDRVDIDVDPKIGVNLSYRTTENLLTLNISHGELDPNLVGLPSLSMLVVDFLHFDSIQSPQLVAGHHPKYDLLCRF